MHCKRSKRTISQLILSTLTTARRPLANFEIRRKITAIRPLISAATIDTSLTTAAKAGVIEKTRSYDTGTSKFLYTAPIAPSIISVVRQVVKGVKIDSAEVYATALIVLPNVGKSQTDNALFALVKRKEIAKSKNPMTDSNTISAQSKFLYSR
jgi:hypothetical protein